MNDVVVLKATNDVQDRVHLADVSEELVAKAFALGRALNKSCDIDKLDDRRRVLLRVMHFRQEIQTAVRNGNNTDVGLNGAEGVVCRFCARVGQRIKKGAFADVRQSHDTKLHVLCSPLPCRLFS